VRPRETLFFVVVWTGKGDPFVEIIHFEAVFWQQSSSKPCTILQDLSPRVILGFRPLCYCPLCGSLCLIPEEFDNYCNETSLHCESSSLRYYWGCLKIYKKSCLQSLCVVHTTPTDYPRTLVLPAKLPQA